MNQVDNNSPHALIKVEKAKKIDYFSPPRPRDDILVIKQAECSSNFMFSSSQE
jgi:hypothetical protein